MLPAWRGMRVVDAATQPLLRAIGKVVGSDVLADAVAFFQAFAGMETGFRDRAEAVIELLRSDVTRYVVVASPHRDTVTEAVWFAGKLAEHGIDNVAGVANRVHPAFGPGTAAEAAAAATAARGRGSPTISPRRGPTSPSCARWPALPPPSCGATRRAARSAHPPPGR